MKKLEFTVSKQNNVDTIKYELTAADVYDDRAADKASQLGNIIPFQYSDTDGKRSVTSYAHEDTTLSIMYKSTLSKKEVLCLMSGLCAAFEIGAQGIPVSYIVKDSDYIFVNRESLAVKCVIVPIKQDVMPLAEIPAFFREVISNMRFSEADKDNYVAELITQINADDFSVSKLKGLIDGQLEKMGLFISKDNGLMNMSDNSGANPVPKDIRVNKLGVMANMQMQQPQMAPMGQPAPMPGMNQPMMGGQPQMNQPMGMAPQAPKPVGQPAPMPGMNQPMPGMNQPMMGGQPQMNQPMGMAPQAPKPMGQSAPMPGMNQPMMGGQPQMNQPMGMAPQAPKPMGQPAPMPGVGQPMMGGQPQMNQPMGMMPQAPKSMGQPTPMPGMNQSMMGGQPQMNQPMGMMPQAPKPVGQPAPMPGMNQPMGMMPQASQSPSLVATEPQPVEDEKEVEAPVEQKIEEPVVEAPVVEEPAPVEEPLAEEPTPVAPTPVAPQPVAPQPVAPTPVVPQPVAPTPKAEEEPPVTPRVEAPQPVTPPIMANSAKPADEAQIGAPSMMGGQNGLVGQLGTKPIPHIVRKKTGETINITKSEFAIGKSKTKADYAIEDNTAISRVHCIIVQKDGVNYIKDNGSTNHTYINGVELQSGKEVLLKNKTVIQMGDEEFTFLLRKGE